MTYNDPQNAPDFHPSHICYKCGAPVVDDDGVWLDVTEGDGCDPGVHDVPFTFLREYLGGRELVRLVSDWDDFAASTTQDYEVADELVQRIRAEGEVVINESDPVYIERYTLLDDETIRAFENGKL